VSPAATTQASRPPKIDKFKGVKGANTNKLPAATGAFALPPPLPEYYEDQGLRKVKPYMFAFQSYAKERWQGRTLIDVFVRLPLVFSRETLALTRLPPNSYSEFRFALLASQGLKR
jgi:hypothetical protein